MNSFLKYIDTTKLDKKIKEERFPFGQQLFWDYPIKDIDLKIHQRFIIERVLTRGFTNDFYILQKIYSIDEIQAALRKSKELDPKTAHFCSWYFNIPLHELHVSSFYH